MDVIIFCQRRKTSKSLKLKTKIEKKKHKAIDRHRRRKNVFGGTTVFYILYCLLLIYIYFHYSRSRRAGTDRRKKEGDARAHIFFTAKTDILFFCIHFNFFLQKCVPFFWGCLKMNPFSLSNIFPLPKTCNVSSKT